MRTLSAKILFSGERCRRELMGADCYAVQMHTLAAHYPDSPDAYDQACMCIRFAI